MNLQKTEDDQDTGKRQHATGKRQTDKRQNVKGNTEQANRNMKDTKAEQQHATSKNAKRKKDRPEATRREHQTTLEWEHDSKDGMRAHVCKCVHSYMRACTADNPAT